MTLSADFDPTPLLSGALNYGKYWNADTNALTDAYRAAAGTARETAAAALWARLAQEAPFAVLCFQNQSVLTLSLIHIYTVSNSRSAEMTCPRFSHSIHRISKSMGVRVSSLS